MKLSLIVLLSIINISLAISSVIIGRVSSSINGAPLIGANIYLEDIGLGSASDNNGEFEIKDVPPGNYTIMATYIGYKLKDIQTISLDLDEEVRCDLIMYEEIYEADNIVITGTRSKRLIKDSPVATEVIHADEIINLGAKNVGEVLEERVELLSRRMALVGVF